MSRNKGAAMPPTNCVRTYGPPSCRSTRVNELKVWHWIMMTTASPRIQSRKGNRFTSRPHPVFEAKHSKGAVAPAKHRWGMLQLARRAKLAQSELALGRTRRPPQNRYFKANWMRRGATEFWVITPKLAVLREVPGLANCGWFRAL